MKKSHWLALIGFACSAGFLWLALRNVRWAELREVMASVRGGWVAMIVVIAGLDLMIRSLRWQVLLRGVPAASFASLFRLEAIGLAVNNVLLLRMGEGARAVLAARELGISLPAAFSSVAVERALDVCALMALFCAASAFEPGLVSPKLRAVAMTILAGGVSALIFLVAAGKSFESGGWTWRLNAWPRAQQLVAQLLTGAAALRSPLAAAKAAALSLSLWMVDALVYWAGARALGFGDIMDYGRSLLVLAWAGAGSAIPAAPGAIGTFEAAVKAIVTSMGAAPAQALGFALLIHMVTYLVVTVIGMACLYRVGLTLAGLKTSLDPA